MLCSGNMEVVNEKEIKFTFCVTSQRWRNGDFMNYDYHFFGLLQELIHIFICVMDENGTVFFPKDISEKNSFFYDSTLCTYLLDICESEPKIFQKDEVCFGGFRWEKRCFIIGPCNIGGLTFIEKYQFAKRYGAKGNDIEIPETSYQSLGDALAVLYYQVTGRKIHGQEIWQDPILEKGKNASGVSEKEQIKYSIRRNFFGKKHLDYAAERKYFEYIRKGEIVPNDVGELEKVGEMAQSGIKQFEYQTVVVITLSCRAAIEGGMEPEAAYELSDLYLQQLEKCMTQSEMLILGVQAMNDYSGHVAKVKEKRENSADYVEQCKVYLCRHQHEKVNMKELAMQMGLNYSYLSRIFSECVGMSLTEYAKKEKLKGAANMLRYTEYSIAEIAEYFCFSSTSRFSEFFKSEYGMKPSQYRKENHVYDFTQNK